MPGNTLLLLVLLIVGVLVSTNGQQLATRAPEDSIKQLKRGVLLKNKKLTSCELAPLDNGCSIAAASCLEYLPGTTTLDTSFEYEVLLDDGIDGIGARYVVEKITLHPYLSLIQLANDFAILQHNSGSPITWQNRISPYYSYQWDAIVYSRAIITDIVNSDWSTALNVSGPTPDWWSLSEATGYTPDITCPHLSGLYKRYHYAMTCSPSLTTPPSSSLSNCQLPMGIAYSIAHDTAFIVGPYIYSEVVGGNSFCNYSYQRSYYVAINAYLYYIAQVVGRSFLVGDEIYTVDMTDYNPEFDMIYPDDPEENPVHPVKLSGDFYKSQSNVAVQKPTSSSDSSTSYESSSIIDSSSRVDSLATSNESSVEESTTNIDIPVMSSEVEVESSYSQTHIKCPTATEAVYSSLSKCAKK